MTDRPNILILMVNSPRTSRPTPTTCAAPDTRPPSVGQDAFRRPRPAARLRGQRLTTDIYPADFGWTPDYRKPGERIDWWYHNLGSVTGAGVAEITNQYEYDDDVAFRPCRSFTICRAGWTPAPGALTVSFTHPHDPFVARRKYWDLYEGAPELRPPDPVAYDDMDPHSQTPDGRLRLAAA